MVSTAADLGPRPSAFSQPERERGPVTEHQDSRGATSAEYALVVSLIAAVIVGVLLTLGSQVIGLFERFDLP